VIVNAAIRRNTEGTKFFYGRRFDQTLKNRRIFYTDRSVVRSRAVFIYRLTMNRFTVNQPMGDFMGVNARVENGLRLHGLWDAGLGTDTSDRFLNEVAATIGQHNPRPAMLDMNLEHWVDEGFALRSQAYSFSGAGTERDPAVLTDEYAAEAKKIASQRAALAGYRLAEFLNAHFR